MMVVVLGCGFWVVGFWLGYLFLLRNLHWQRITNQQPKTHNPQPGTTTHNQKLQPTTKNLKPKTKNIKS